MTTEPIERVGPGATRVRAIRRATAPPDRLRSRGPDSPNGPSGPSRPDGPNGPRACAGHPAGSDHQTQPHLVRRLEEVSTRD